MNENFTSEGRKKGQDETNVMCAKDFFSGLLTTLEILLAGSVGVLPAAGLVFSKQPVAAAAAAALFLWEGGPEAAGSLLTT